MQTPALNDALRADCGNARAINEENLMRILAENADTVFGREHRFAEIRDASDYRARVPLQKYADLEPYILRMREGDARQLTAYRVLAFAQTSGTESEPKFIPATDRAQAVYGNGFEQYQDTVVRETGGMRLYINTFRSDPDKPMEPLLLYSEIYYRHLYDTGRMDMEQYAGGLPLMFCAQPGESAFGKAWVALLEENITVIESIFLYDQLYFFNYLETNWDKLLRSIRRREIPEDVALAEPIREKLLSLPADEARLRRVEAAAAQGFDGIARRLWPRLRLITGVSNRGYASEDAALRRYVGDVPQFYFCYGASECYFGAPVRENAYDYVLLPRHAFFEFLPYGNGDGGGQTLLPHELETGALYEILFTSFAGLYRYRIGDVVRVTGYVGESPVMEYAFRKNLAINLAGEKMGTLQIEAAMQALRAAGWKIEMYCLGASIDRLPGRYLAAIALEQTEGMDADALSAALDRALQDANSDYRDLRKLGSLGQASVYLFDRDRYRDFLRANGLTGGHNKPKHIAPDGFSEEVFATWNSRE